MKTKTISKMFFCITLLLVSLFMGLSFCFVPNFSASADIFSNQSIQDSNFTVTMYANSRSKNALQREERTVTVHNQQITYLCFKWKDLESLSFFFASRIADKNQQFLSYKFDVAYLPTDDLTHAFGTEDEKRATLIESNIQNNTFSQANFYYYVDSNRTESATSTRNKGFDFGLYKFNFSYTYFDESTMQQPSPATIGQIYVAVLPDDIDSIPSHQDIRIVYSVASSTKLMNVYKLTLSNESFKFVKPELIEWQVTGIGKDKRYYCLNKNMKQENMIYANYTALWDSNESTTGTTFTFDSNDVEGTWDVVCIIKNSDGTTEKMRLTLEDLSTIKVPAKSYLWLILLIIALVLVLALIVTLIIIIKHKKQEKVW